MFLLKNAAHRSFRFQACNRRFAGVSTETEHGVTLPRLRASAELRPPNKGTCPMEQSQATNFPAKATTQPKGQRHDEQTACNRLCNRQPCAVSPMDGLYRAQLCCTARKTEQLPYRGACAQEQKACHKSKRNSGNAETRGSPSEPTALCLILGNECIKA